MKEMGLYEAKARFSAVIAGLEASGEPVAITRHGRIVAELHPHKPGLAPKRGCLKSSAFHIAPDFDHSESGFEDFFEDAEPASRIAEDEAPCRFTKKD